MSLISMRNAYRQKSKKQVTEWMTNVNDLMAKAAQAKREGGEDFSQKVAELHASVRSAEENVEQLGDTQSGDWEKVKTAVEEAFGEIKNMYDNLVKRLR